jgi:hypothetical protein
MLVCACGYQEDSSPEITGIRPALHRYQVGFPNGEGEVALTGIVDFQDPDGDVMVLHVRWRECGIGPVKELDILQEDLGKATSGSISFIIVISTDCPVGEYAVRLSISDGQGNRSDVVDSPYEIFLPE